jgi:hypothetical protein
MHTVVWTSTFLAQAKRHGLSQEEMDDIVNALSADPQSGDVMAGTGGARKLRHVGRGKGKSGGYRTIHYYGGDDMPVFLLSVFSKGTTANLTKAERNELAKVLPQMADAYRKNVKEMVTKLGRRK